MHPTFYLPQLDLTIPSQHAMLALAVIVGLVLGPLWMARLERLPPRRIVIALVSLLLVALIGGHLHFVMNTWSVFYAARPLAALEFWSGQHAAGAALALILFTPLIARALALPLGKLADALVPTAALCLAIARVGCFLRGCCYGTVCHWPWCVTFPPGTYVYEQHRSLGFSPLDAARSAPVHPLQLYFAAVGLGIMVVALGLYPRKRFDGEVGLVALLIFSATSAVLEFWRGDFPERAYWGQLPQLAWAALAMTILCGAALAVAERRRGRRGCPHVAES